MTVLQLIVHALCAIGHMAPGREPNASEKAHALRILNRMLQSWNTQRLAIFAIARTVYNLTAGEDEYSMGDVNSDRPIRIERAGLIPAGSTKESDIEVLTLDRYRAGNPGVYLDRSHPLATLYIQPEPAAADQLILYTWTPISTFAAVTDEIELPEGYEEAVTYNLAVRFGVEFGRPASPDLHKLARDAKAHIKSLNAPAYEMRCDPALLGGRGSFNILTGQ